MSQAYELIKCPRCDGNGIVAHYDMDGFISPDECRDCNGAGTIVRYQSGVLASYAGGPLLGRDPKRELAK